MSKPSTSATVNSGNALTTNLVAAFLLNEGTGTTAKDYVSGTFNLTLSGASWSDNGITCATASAKATGTTPSGLKLSLPITIYARLIPTSTAATDNSNYFGVLHNSSNTSPFVGYSIGHGQSGGGYQGNYNSSGTFRDVASSTDPASDAATATDIALVVTSTGSTLFRNSTSIGTLTEAASNPTYDATSLMGFGDLLASGENTQAEFVFGYIFNADMSGDLATIQSAPYALFAEPGTAPAAPTNIAVGTVTSSSVPLSWDAVTSATGYTLQYDTVNTFDQGPTTIEIDAADTETADVLDLASETTYYFRVRAKNASGNSEWGTATDGTTQYVSATTLAPAALAADAGTDQTITDTDATLDGSASGGTSPYAYAWEATTKPAGASEITATGATPTITFDMAGDYVLTLTVTDNDGTTDTDTVAITVDPLATSPVSITPLSITIAVNGTRQFTAHPVDQFGDALTPSDVSWSNDGTGTIDTNGLYTAPATVPEGGSDTVRVGIEPGNAAGAADVTIVAPLFIAGAYLAPGLGLGLGI